jgi:hypothetical protein
MTKEEVKLTFKFGSGKDIANALTTYFDQGIAEKKIKPLQFYKSGDFQKENISAEKDIVAIAQDIFSV